MDKGNGDDDVGAAGIMPGTSAWELARLIGRYEEATKTIFNRLDNIDNTNGKILEQLREINGTIIERGTELDIVQDDVESLNRSVTALKRRNSFDLSRNSKLQIIANFGVSILNILATAWSKIAG